MNKPKLGLAVALYLAALMLADLLSPLAGVQGRIAPLVFCLIVFFSFAWFVPARAWRPLLMAIAATSAALAALALAQIGTYPRPQSIFGSPNILAGYACLHVFLALFLASQARWPWLWYGVAGLNAAAVGASQSLGGLLAISASGLFILAARRPRLLPEGLAAAACLFAAIATLTPVAHAHARLLHDPRLLIWWEGLKMARWRLLTGWGQHDFLLPPDFLHFYNAALTTLVAAGVLGLVAWVGMLAAAWHAMTKWPQAQERLMLKAFLVGWIVNGMFIYDTPETAVPFYVVLALLISAINRHVADLTALVDNRQPLEDVAAGAGHAV